MGDCTRPPALGHLGTPELLTGYSRSAHLPDPSLVLETRALVSLQWSLKSQREKEGDGGEQSDPAAFPPPRPASSICLVSIKIQGAVKMQMSLY